MVDLGHPAIRRCVSTAGGAGTGSARVAPSQTRSIGSTRTYVSGCPKPACVGYDRSLRSSPASWGSVNCALTGAVLVLQRPSARRHRPSVGGGWSVGWLELADIPWGDKAYVLVGALSHWSGAKPPGTAAECADRVISSLAETTFTSRRTLRVRADVRACRPPTVGRHRHGLVLGPGRHA